jgi:hypothetical protein
MRGGEIIKVATEYAPTLLTAVVLGKGLMSWITDVSVIRIPAEWPESPL